MVHKALWSQVTVAAVVGAFALAGIAWASGLVIRDQIRTWGERWLDNLDELAPPLYLFDDPEKYARVEDYIDKFSEILFVRYYSASGEPIFTKVKDRAYRAIEPVEPARLADVANRPGSSQRHLIDAAPRDLPVVRIAKPIWAKSVRADGLLGFDASSTPVDRTLTGYVELGLDFSGYLAYDLRAILIAAAIAALLVTAASWLIYRRVAQPFSALQDSLQRLASGEKDVSVATSGPREIVAIADALDERDRKLTELANRDALTGLPNRKAFHTLLEQEVAHVAASGRASALLFLDLDQFKHVNDSLSQATGDRLLQLVAARLQASMRAGDVLARFGGDEFAILLRGVSQKEAAGICAALIERMDDGSFSVGDSLSEGGGSVTLRCSIGATMIRGANVEPGKLLTRADRACYQAKMNGRNQFAFYRLMTKDCAERAADAAWSQKIHKALREDSFVLHYQPIVNVRTGATAYHEVLLRMLVGHDELQFPMSFLPAAARMGLTVDIDRWVIRQALRSLAAQRMEHGDVRFTLNVSGSTFDRADFFDSLEAELALTGVPLDAVVIEITEQTAMRNLDLAAARMAELVDRGCRFAIDDFGSGYCSYNYLKELPIGFVKIDGAFIANVTENEIDRRIVAAIADVAAAANCEAIAEHVKDYATLELLEGLGVSYAQGYILGRPAAEVTPAVWPTTVATGERREPRRAIARPRAARVAARAN